MLRLCPFTDLKIDMSIIQAMEFDPIARHFFETTIELAKNIGLQVVAEGIETENQLSIVRDSKVDIGQGYLFGKAESETAFRARLQRSNLDVIAS